MIKNSLIDNEFMFFKDNIAKFIDHTLLKIDATLQELKQLCNEAKQWNFLGVCVNSSNILLVSKELYGTQIIPIAVVGFPLGASSTLSKVVEAKNAINDGAKEIDMVINIGALKSKNYTTVMTDICRVVKIAQPYQVKVILEMSQLNYKEKIIACAISKASGASFIKTSTGFNVSGATIEDVSLMRMIVGYDMGVKASGGIKTKNDLITMIKAGANRIGTSKSSLIMLENNDSKY